MFAIPSLIFFCLTAVLSAADINLNDYNEWNILQLVEKLVPTNPVIVQAGGGHGEIALQMVNQWPQAKIYAFEPNPEFFHILSSQTVGRANVKVYPWALNEHAQSSPFYMSNNKSNSRIGSLLKSADPWKWYYSDSSVINVNCINLQEWALKELSRIDFLWLNIGGAELRVLESIPRLLPMIQVIFLETHFQEFRQGLGTYADVKDFLARSDFEEIQHWHVPQFQGYAIFAKRGLARIIK